MDEFKQSKPYSRELPPWAAYATSLPVRISKHEDTAVEISQNFEFMIEQAGLPTKSPHGQEYLGCAEFGHSICLAVPECLPERIPTLVRLCDSFCIIDFAALKDGQIGHHKQGPSTRCGPKLAMKLLLAKQGLVILLKHPLSGFGYLKRCISYLKSLKHFSPTMPEEGASFVDLFPSRFYDVGSPGMIASLEFGMGIKLTRDEAQKLHQLAVHSCSAIAMSNDIFSWPMEQLEQQETQKLPFSCIIMLMQEFLCCEEEALVRCRHKMLQYERACHELSRELRDSPLTSLAVKKMALAYPLTVSGGAIWHATCLRYQCDNSSMDLVRKVMGTALPPVELDDAFKEESDKILLLCQESCSAKRVARLMDLQGAP